MTVFVDTSAFYALLDADDTHHRRARETWSDLLHRSVPLLTNNYVLLETSALLQRQLGMPALRAFCEDVAPLLHVQWVTEQHHRAATEAVLAASRRQLSIVDCVSFQTMRDLGVRTAFCFDADFREQGFRAAP